MKKTITLAGLIGASLFLNACMQSSVGPASNGLPSTGIYGTLQGAQGAPAGNALVRVYADTDTSVVLSKLAIDSGLQIDSTNTDAYGRFSFPNLKPGNYNLECTTRKSGDTQAVFLPRIQLDSNCNLNKVTLHAPGNILIAAQSDAGVMLSGVICDIPGSPFSAISDSAGECFLQNVPAGSFQVRLRDVGFLTALSPSLEVQSGKTTNGGIVTLHPIPGPAMHFSVDSSTVALWTFNAKNGGQFVDSASHHFVLIGNGGYAMQSSSFDSAIVFNGESQILSTDNSPVLTVGGTGKITYEVRIFLDQYPSTSNFNEEASVMGMYEGLKMQIWYDGRLQVGAQKVDSTGTGYWFAPASDPGVVPLNRWVDVAVALDQTSGRAYGYVDGEPIQLHGDSTNTDPWRVSTSIFTVGEDRNDDQQFTGKIDEIRVSNNLPLGRGLALIP